VSPTATTPIVVIPVFLGDDGVWEALVEPVTGGDDLQTRDALDEAHKLVTTVRVLGEEKILALFLEGEGRAVARYDEALPG
jgi:hypothetical protein